MSLGFEYEPSILAEPEFVTAHEAGHAVLAYYHGHEIGRTRFFLFAGQIAGAHEHIPLPDPGSERSVDSRAERLLAGDLAARLISGMRADRISLPIRTATRLGRFTSAKRLALLLQESGVKNGQGGAQHDVLKVMNLIIQYRSDRFLWSRRWWAWFWRRAFTVREILQSERGGAAHTALGAFYMQCLRRDAAIPGEITSRILRDVGAPQAPASEARGAIT